MTTTARTAGETRLRVWSFDKLRRLEVPHSGPLPAVTELAEKRDDDHQKVRVLGQDCAEGRAALMKKRPRHVA